MTNCTCDIYALANGGDICEFCAANVYAAAMEGNVASLRNRIELLEKELTTLETNMLTENDVERTASDMIDTHVDEKDHLTEDEVGDMINDRTLDEDSIREAIDEKVDDLDFATPDDLRDLEARVIELVQQRLDADAVARLAERPTNFWQRVRYAFGF